MRRDFLKLCGWAGLGLAAPIGLTDTGHAQTKGNEPYEGPYYIVFNASGGWDTTYLMDPKGIDESNRLYKQGEIETRGAHRFAPTAEHIQQGLSNEKFFDTYGDELLVLNGLDYSVNNHSPCSRYMATGKLDSLAYPTFAALVAACKGSHCPLAFLTFGNYSATGNLVAMSRIPYLPTLKLIARADHVEGGSHAYHDDFVARRIEETLQAHNVARGAETRLPRTERAESMLYAAQVNSKAMSRVTPFIAANAPKERLARQAEIALASFKAGICVSANLSIGQFDSHANNDRDQMKLIPELLAGVDYLMTRAEALGVRDRLVVVIQSEMGRTPHYNKGDGKDHWSIGSIMFLGHGIQGGRVIGGTDDGHFPHRILPSSLSVDAENGIKVKPEHLHLAMRELAKIESHPFAKRFPLDVAERGETLQGLWGGS